MDPRIKFTYETNVQQLNFLDVLIYKDGNNIERDIYSKPTDSYNYVPFISGHPKHILRNIPYVLAKRINRIVSKENLKKKRLLEMHVRLKKLGYPDKLISDAIAKSKIGNITNNSDENKNDKIISYVKTYNPNNPNVYHEIIKPSFSSLKLTPIFKNYTLRNSYKQPKSLLNILARRNRIPLTGVKKCSNKRCECCKSLIVGTSFPYEIMGETKTFNVKHNMNCETKDVIYALQCQGCEATYIGQTGDSLRARVRVHRQQIRDDNYRSLYVSNHIFNCAHDSELKFRVMPILKLPPNCARTYREEKEKLCIKIIKPSLNRDM